VAEIASSKAVQSDVNVANAGKAPEVEEKQEVKPVAVPVKHKIEKKSEILKTEVKKDIFTAKTHVKVEKLNTKIDLVTFGKDKKEVFSPTELQIETNNDIFDSIVEAEIAHAETDSVIEQKNWQQKLLRKSTEMSETIQKNIPKLPETPKINVNLKETETFIMLNNAVSKAADPLNKAKESFEQKRQDVQNGFDKLVAIVGEKEKDLKDKLSDTTKRLMPKRYDPLAEVDTGMEHADHHSQKKLRDRTSQGKSQTDEQKELSIRQRINYKLLEIKGEILNLSNRIKLGFQKRVRKRLAGELKKVKQDIVGTLDKVESLIDPDDEN
jgi:hypothetical protein